MMKNTIQVVPTRKARMTVLARMITVAALFAAMPTASLAQLNEKVLPQTGPLSKQTISRLALTDVARAGGRIIAVGDRGYIVYSDSNGENWERAKTPANVPMLTAVSFADTDTVWAVGHDSTILKSANKGGEWTQSYSSPKDQRPLMDIMFSDANTGFAVGAYGAFYETVDGGKTWSSRKVIPAAPKAPPTAAKEDKGGRGKADALADDDAGKSGDEDKHLNAIVKLGDGRLLIVGEAGTMLLSLDAGKSWARVPSPYRGSFFGAVSADDGSVVIFGLRGNIYRSNDASLSSWTQVNANTKASIMGATKLDNGAVVLSGLSGTLLISRDNGKSFTPMKTDTTKALAAPTRGGSNSILVVGESGPRDVLLTDATPAPTGAPVPVSAPAAK
jgi:photosystem II stability/assembly factor-like uncharacterized protein